MGRQDQRLPSQIKPRPASSKTYVRPARPIHRAGTRPPKHVPDDLDSGTSDDEETIELRRFWSQLKERRGSKRAATGSDRPQSALSLPLPTRPQCHASAWKRGDAPVVDGAAAREAVTPTAARRSLSIPRKSGRPIVPPQVFSPVAKHRRLAGATLWRWSEDMSFEVLCFLSAECVRRLVCACTVLRQTCSTCVAGVWRLVAPHLHLNSRNCGVSLDHVWLARTLWLEARDLSAKAAGTLLTDLARPGDRAVRGLRKLDLRNTKLENADKIVPLVRACAGLQFLDLSRTRLRDSGAKDVAGGLVYEPETGDFSPHRTLRILALESIGLTCESGPDIASALQSTPLEVLLLGRNQVADTGAKALARALAVGGQTRLTKLDISMNRLTSVGLAAIVGALGANRTLQCLDAGGNERIGHGLAASSDHAEKVSVGLMAAESLLDLHLWGCGLSDEACRIILDAQPRQLELLNLASNCLSPALRNKLIQMSRNCGPFAALRM